MKIRSVIVWGFVVLVFGLTVAISWDQIHNRDTTIQNQKARVVELESKLPGITREINRMKAENLALIQRFEEEKAKLESRQRLQDSLQEASELVAKIQQAQPEGVPGESVSLQENARRQIAARKEILETMQVGQPLAPSYVPSATPSVANSPLPSWIPPTQTASVKIIKDRAITKWKDDYSMVNYVIDSESEAFQKLLQYNRSPNSEVKRLLATAAQKWPNDYSMMVYTVESQLEAKQKLDRR